MLPARRDVHDEHIRLQCVHNAIRDLLSSSSSGGAGLNKLHLACSRCDLSS